MYSSGTIPSARKVCGYSDATQPQWLTRFILSAGDHIVGLLTAGFGHSMAIVPVVYLSIWSFWELRGASGQSRPAGRIPKILILRPFRSVRRDEVFQNWIAPALWQFGQPIIPVDPVSTRSVTRGAPRVPSLHDISSASTKSWIRMTGNPTYCRQCGVQVS